MTDLISAVSPVYRKPRHIATSAASLTLARSAKQFWLLHHPFTIKPHADDRYTILSIMSLISLYTFQRTFTAELVADNRSHEYQPPLTLASY